VRHVSIAGYPEGHPDIADDVLWSALRRKAGALREHGLDGSIITQFGFDEGPILDWVARVRAEGITLPIRIGVPGPAGVRRLIAFATRFGVGANAMVVKKYGFSLANLMGSAGPDKLIRALDAASDPAVHGELHLHFYTFGGLAKTSEWLRDFRG
jgi:methylenetetrahydrofolate reductase (NADPH)